MRIAIAQTDCLLGDVAGNISEAETYIKRATEHDIDLVVFPELSLHGYALGVVDGDTSVRAGDERLADLARNGPDVLVGIYEAADQHRYNSAVYLSDGHVVHVHRKVSLPHYRMWEERKHFVAGESVRRFDTSHVGTSTLICNDVWHPVLPWLAAHKGAELLLVPANSAVADESLDNTTYWHDLVRNIARMQQCWVVFVNRVGEENGVRFWGGSQVVDPRGSLVAEAPHWEPALTVADIDATEARQCRSDLPLLDDPLFEFVVDELEEVRGASTRRDRDV